MPNVYRATIATNPNIGTDQPVDGATVTGHSSTTAASSGEAFAENKSCRWSGFPAGLSNRLSATLKVTHTSSGALVNGGGTAQNSFNLEYSLNNGGSWNSIASRTNFTTSQGPTVFSLALGAGQDLTQVQVRDRLTTSTNNINDQAAVTVTISDIQIEVIQTPQPIVCM